MSDQREQLSKSGEAVLVSAPALKFVIGTVASLCSVFCPRLIAMLTFTDRANVTFISADYAERALLFSLIVGLVIAIFEWRVPRPPRDTFMATLGIPAILAGALTANQGAAELQRTNQTQGEAIKAALDALGITIEPANGTGSEGGGKQGFLRDPFVTPVHAQGVQSNPPVAQASTLGIVVNQPRYFVVLDRAKSQADAQAILSALTQRLNAAAPSHPFKGEINQQAREFLIVATGGPRIKSDAALEAIRLKNTYQVVPTLVEVSKD